MSQTIKVWALLLLTVAPLAAGSHDVSFDVRDLPSGVNLYRLTADGVSVHKKMMLLR